MSVNDQHPPAAGRPKRMGRARIASAVAVLFVLAACNGDDDTTPSTRPPITSDTMFVTTTTEPTPSTSQASTTAGDASPSTSSVTTTAPTTDSGPSTSAPDLSQDEQAVVDALVAAWTAFNEIKLDPTNDSKLEAVALTHRGDALDAVVTLVQNLRIDERRSITNTDTPAVVVPFADTVVLEGDTATIEYCWVNSNVLVETGGNADGTDRVIDDSVSAVVQRDTIERSDGRWLLVVGDVIERFPEEVSCDALR